MIRIFHENVLIGLRKAAGEKFDLRLVTNVHADDHALISASGDRTAQNSIVLDDRICSTRLHTGLNLRKIVSGRVLDLTETEKCSVFWRKT